jgi:hypothetical protein
MRHVALRGKDLHSPSNEIVENNTGASISGLKVVALDGFGTKFPQVKVANPNLFPSFGVSYEQIENNKTGLICCFGFVYELDTSIFSVNDVLYSDINGNLNTAPLGEPIAIVVKSDISEGIIRVLNIVNKSSFFYILDRIEITQQDMTNKYVTLSQTPSIPNNVILDMEGGIRQSNGIDYIVMGNILSWDGLGLDGFIDETDVLSIQYNFFLKRE